MHFSLHCTALQEERALRSTDYIESTAAAAAVTAATQAAGKGGAGAGATQAPGGGGGKKGRGGGANKSKAGSREGSQGVDLGGEMGDDEDIVIVEEPVQKTSDLLEGAPIFEAFWQVKNCGVFLFFFWVFSLLEDHIFNPIAVILRGIVLFLCWP